MEAAIEDCWADGWEEHQVVKGPGPIAEDRGCLQVWGTALGSCCYCYLTSLNKNKFFINIIVTE